MRFRLFVEVNIIVPFLTDIIINGFLCVIYFFFQKHTFGLDADIATEVKRYYKAKAKSSPNLFTFTQEVKVPEVTSKQKHHSHKSSHCSDLIYRAHANLCCCCVPSFVTCCDSTLKCKNIQEIYEKLDKKSPNTSRKISNNEARHQSPELKLTKRSKSMVNITNGNPILYRDLVPLGNVNNLILQRFPDAYLFKRTRQCKPECSGLNTKNIKVCEMAYEIQAEDQQKSINSEQEKLQENRYELLTTLDKKVTEKQITNGFDFVKKKKRKNLSERISEVLRKRRTPQKNQR